MDYNPFDYYQKAFDSVQQGKLREILQNYFLANRDVRIISNLYWNQTANIRLNGEDSEDIQIKRGVGLGCMLSPLLFNI